MQIAIKTIFYYENSNGTHQQLGLLLKAHESEIIPTVNAKIQDPVWEKDREIKSLMINFDENRYRINFTEIIKREDYKMYKTMYESHGWKELTKPK